MVLAPGWIVPHSAAVAEPASASHASSASTSRRTSEPERGAVAARIGAAEQRAVAEAHRVRLARSREQLGRWTDRVTLANEQRPDAPRHPALEVHRVRCLLRI